MCNDNHNNNNNNIYFTEIVTRNKTISIATKKQNQKLEKIFPKIVEIKKLKFFKTVQY